MLKRSVALVLLLSACSAERGDVVENVPAGTPAEDSVSIAPDEAVAITPQAEVEPEEILPELKLKEPPPLTVVKVTPVARAVTTHSTRDVPPGVTHQKSAPGETEASPETMQTLASTAKPDLTQELAPKQLLALSPQLPRDSGRWVKLDTRGKPLTATAKTWSCVRDEQTGLIWEGKAEGAKRNRAYTYAMSGSGGQCGHRSCAVAQYIQRLNGAALCGIKAWRLPRRHELLELVYAAMPDPYPKIDVRYFPNTQRGSYWSVTEFQYNPQRMWAVNFTVGQDNSHDRAAPAYLRLVAGQ